ncbi:hypothetical protein LTR97_005034 [Elasticomyces elasticus]|uniref:Carbohydrate kinase PfkB domain-containing protein n=1 Tax=Elasticomyces elasticus TaxID=574655 RepID=A0AAN8A329_9PEZI|nr:hypothetical protein LTR97_005034 [Elasticomyces elasticus]
MSNSYGESRDSAATIDFVTLGMFIIDDIHPPPSANDQTPKKDIVGGAGTYSAIGARLFLPSPTTSKAVGWIIDAGTDFPADVRSTIDSWQTNVLIRPRDGLTTRGWNGYGDNDHRAFKYLSPKKRLTADDLTPSLLRSKSFHLICSPERCIEMVQQIWSRRAATFGEDEARPIIIWEPVPDLCILDEFDNAVKAIKYVDVISPNHEELAALFGQDHAGAVNKELIEQQARHLNNSGIGADGMGMVVVRAGKVGCYLATAGKNCWLPAYHQDATRVIDPTGGGNGFLGGLAVGLVRTNDMVEAARMGSVAASYCIEQVGVPSLTVAHREHIERLEEWNGTSVFKRLAEFRTRTA